MIQFECDGVAPILRQRLQAFPFWKVLPNESVGVLVAASFPRMVGRREVELQPVRFLDLGVSMELAAIVRGDGAYSS